MSIADGTYVTLLPIMAIIFYLIPIALRPAFMLMASYAYYLTFSWAYFPVLVGVTIISYIGGLLIERFKGSRYLPLLVGMLLIVCFTPMFCYKLIVPWIQGDLRSGADWGLTMERLPIPVGMSFYTFASAGYLVDVALGISLAAREAVKLGLFCGFFPCVCQGPVSRTGSLFLQFDFISKLSIARLEQAGSEILVGLILKRVFTGAFYEPSQLVYANLASSSPLEHLVATIYFAFQVYADWTGYALIAIGSARLFGVDLPFFFRQPYLAGSSVEFWRSWNVSLVDWMRDYIFVPLNLSTRKILGRIAPSIAILVTLVLLGLWHAAGWGFVIYGVVNGVLVASSEFTSTVRDRLVHQLYIPKGMVRCWRIGLTFLIHVLVLVLVRADSLSQASAIYQGLVGQIFLFNVGSPEAGLYNAAFRYISFDYRPLLIVVMIIGDLLARYRPLILAQVPWPARLVLYTAGVAILAPFITGESKPFLYFQF